MSRCLPTVLIAAIGLALPGRGPAAEKSAPAPAAIVCKSTAMPIESLAAKEVRRYVYLRTGTLLPIVKMELNKLPERPERNLIVVAYGCRAAGLYKDYPALEAARNNLGREQYVLKTLSHAGRKTLFVLGDPLYGAYRLAEHLGVRFYLHGDTVPDRQVAFALPQLDEVGKPLFDRRGIQPFHDFPEGPDWWNADEYKAVLGQLPKLRMNFFGLHTYPQGGVGPEPAVWIGLADDCRPDGHVQSSYPSRHFTTSNLTGAWGYRGRKTGDYAFGAAAIFDRDDYGADYMRGVERWNQMSPAQCDALFDRMGDVLGDAFGWAHRLGVKTCIGTETPLVVPTLLRQRLEQRGLDPRDPATIEKLYEGMFTRIMRIGDLDYYWLWTPEGWTWQPVKQEQVDATLADLRAAIAAAKSVKAPFELATCGWVLGPQQDRALFDNVLPKDMPMSCINREVGQSPVEPGFARVAGRPKWAIPWLEDDPALIVPQLWAGRMRKDAVDARQYGCTGLMGIHWRTRVLAPNVAALAAAAWDQSWHKADRPAATAKVPEGAEGGKFAAFAGNKIVGTDDPLLYQTVRYDAGAYRFDLPDGAYKVTLKFVEPHYDSVHKRVFGVKIQGKPAIESLDLFRQVGKNKVYDRTFDNVAVTGGRLLIEFVYQLEYPCIAAIVIEGDKATRRINCGGPAHGAYAADWPAAAESGRNRDRFLPVNDFYADWAAAEFGAEAAKPIAAWFAKQDGHLPRPATWVNGPGGLAPDSRPWEETAKQYAFVDELATLRPTVQGAGNLERFDYWLNNFYYLRATARVANTWTHYAAAAKLAKAEKDPAAQKRLAEQTLLPLRRQLLHEVREVHKYLLATLSTPGEMGTVTNWQQHIMPMILDQPGEELAKMLGSPLPADAQPSAANVAAPRLFVPVVRTAIGAKEKLKIEAIVVGGTPQEVVFCWRPLGGGGEFQRLPLTHVARGAYAITLPAEATRDDLEYHVRATLPDGTKLRFPATAPQLSQTVVVAEN